MTDERQSRLRAGYGSEWHLLRYLGRHRSVLSAQVCGITRATSVEWLDFDFSGVADAKHNYGDYELTGVDFLPTGHAARAAWPEFWPQRGGVQNWDAVGVLQYPDHREWLLLEAKANVEELRSASGAKNPGSVGKIRDALDATKRAVGVDASCDWSQPYYQYANRLAFLHFLGTQGVAARLCFLYFTGDDVPGRSCPKSRKEWQPALDAMKAHLGLTGRSELESRVHHAFLPVTPGPGTLRRLKADVVRGEFGQTWNLADFDFGGD
jgi:hypothetical protein